MIVEKLYDFRSFGSDSVILDLFREMTVPFGDPPAVGGGKKPGRRLFIPVTPP